MLRAGLLRGQVVAVSRDLGASLREALEGLGAQLRDLVPGDLESAEAEAWLAQDPRPAALIFDAEPAFGAGGEAGLNAMLEAAWSAVRLVAAGLLIPDGRPGKLVLLAPRPPSTSRSPDQSTRWSAAARAALENLARTLSIEWARYGITITAVAPGADLPPTALETLAAYLLSPAGAYFSGCELALGQPVSGSSSI